MNNESHVKLIEFNMKMLRNGHSDPAISENLKLPICPKCNNTKNTECMTVGLLLHAGIQYPWFKCTHCKIQWNAVEGIQNDINIRHY